MKNVSIDINADIYTEKRNMVRTEGTPVPPSSFCH